MSKISRSTQRVVTSAKNAVGGRGETAALCRSGSFADYTVISLHCLRVYLEKSYRDALDLLSEVPHILADTGLKPDGLHSHSILVIFFIHLR